MSRKPATRPTLAGNLHPAPAQPAKMRILRVLGLGAGGRQADLQGCGLGAGCAGENLQIRT